MWLTGTNQKKKIPCAIKFFEPAYLSKSRVPIHAGRQFTIIRVAHVAVGYFSEAPFPRVPSLAPVPSLFNPQINKPGE